MKRQYRQCARCRQRYSVPADRACGGVYICQDCAERNLARIQHRSPRLIYRHGMATVIFEGGKRE